MSQNHSADSSPARSVAIALAAGLLVLAALLWGRTSGGDTAPGTTPPVPQPPSGMAAVELPEASGSHDPEPPAPEPPEPEPPAPESAPTDAQPVVPEPSDAPLELRERRPVPPDGPRWELVVRVTRKDGSPATDALVQVSPAGKFVGEPSGLVDENAERRVQAITRGRVVVLAWDGAGDAAAVSHLIDRTPEQVVELRLEPYGFVAATVRRGSGADGAARSARAAGDWIDTVQVVFTSLADPEISFELDRTRTGRASGALRYAAHPFPRRLLAAGGAFRVIADGYLPGHFTRTAAELATGPQELVLEPAGAVVGRCVTPAGSPLRGVTLRGAQGTHSVSGADGRFRLKPLPLGETHLVATFDGRIAVRVPIHDLEERQDIGDVVLATGGELSGSLRLLGKQRKTLVAWLWSNDLEVFVNKVYVHGDGRFAFGGVGSGTHGVAIAPAREGPSPALVVHGKWVEGTSDAVVPYQPLLELEVEFVSATTGESIEVGKATVTIREAGTTEIVGGTTWDGDPFSSMEVTDLPPGRVDVDVRVPGRVDVDVRVPGYRTSRVDGVEIEDGLPARVRVSLTPLAR